jgi:hypothetical protein
MAVYVMGWYPCFSFRTRRSQAYFALPYSSMFSHLRHDNRCQNGDDDDFFQRIEFISRSIQRFLMTEKWGIMGASVLFSASMIPLQENYAKHSLVLPFLYTLALIFIARGKEAKDRHPMRKKVLRYFISLV